MSMIIGCILAALVLAFVEVLLPGGVLGVLAALCVLAATWFGFDVYGPLAAIVVFCGTLIGMAVLLLIEFKWLLKTSIGQHLLLKTSVVGHTRKPPAENSMVGHEGIALTRLNPSGRVVIQGKNYDACSQDGYIQRNQPVVVVAQDTFKLIIKKQ